jgi:hypothetical protein
MKIRDLDTAVFSGFKDELLKSRFISWSSWSLELLYDILLLELGLEIGKIIYE